MRTTVTLDPDVERLLHDAMHRSRRSFKDTLNTALRTALDPKRTAASRAGFVVKARPMGLRPGIDPSGLNRLVDDLEINDVLAPPSRVRRA